MTARPRPVSPVAAAGGVLILAAVVSLVIGLSYALLLPAEQTADLPPAPSQTDEQRAPGEVVCDRPAVAPAALTEVTSTALIECPALYDGRRITFTGEAVGIVLLRRAHAWVHVNDDVYANSIGPLSRHRTVAGGNSGMAVVMPREDAVGVTAGNSRVHGTAVQVTGTFHRAYEGDAGAPALEADEVTVLRDATSIAHPLSVRRVVAASLLGLVTLALLVIRQGRRAR